MHFINSNKRLAPIGRLDKNTTGLLFLTNDGDLHQYLTPLTIQQLVNYPKMLQDVANFVHQHLFHLHNYNVLLPLFLILILFYQPLHQPCLLPDRCVARPGSPLRQKLQPDGPAGHDGSGGLTVRSKVPAAAQPGVLEALAALPLSAPRDSQSIGHVCARSLVGSHILSYRYGLLRQSG